MARRSLQADRLEELLSERGPSEDAPRQLARLAALATTVRQHTDLEAPSPDFRERLRAELLATATTAPEPALLDRARDHVDVATARWRHSLRVAGASGMAAAMIGTTGVAAAAQSALPGDVLYSVKGFTEDARLAFAAGDLDRGRLHLAFARERLEEVEQGRHRLTPPQFIETLDRLDVEAARGADEMLAAAVAAVDGQPILDELDAFTAEMRARLIDVSADLPLSVRPATERSLELLRRIDLQIGGVLTPSSCQDCGPADWLPRVVLPGEGPAVTGCNCVGDVVDGVPRGDDRSTGIEDGAVPAATTEAEVAPVDPDPTNEVPSEGGSELLDDLDRTVDDTASDAHTTVDDAASDLHTTVDDTASELHTSVDDTASELHTTVDDTASELHTTVDDTASELDTSVDDTASELGSLVDDLLESSGNQTGGGLLE